MTEASKEARLEPCPFCGGPSAFGKVDYSAAMVREQEWDQSTFFYVNCICCGSSNMNAVGHRTREDAAAKWNTRAPALSLPAPSGDEVEVVARALMSEEFHQRLGEGQEWTDWHGLARAALSAMPLATVRAKAMEEAARVVEGNKVQSSIAKLAPRTAESINKAFDEIAAAIRSLASKGEGA